MTVEQAMEMPTEEYLGWLEFLEEEQNRPDTYCHYLAEIAYRISYWGWRFAGGKDEPAPDPKDFLLKFRNRLDPIPEKTPEQIEADKETEFQNRNMKAKSVLVGGLNAKTPEQLARERERRKTPAPVKKPTKSPPPRNKRK